MSTKPDSPHTEKHSNAVAGILKVARAIAIFPVVMAVIFFVAAGRPDWI